MNGKVTQEEINKVVWQACDTFRGVIDPSQYKDYILTMLFLKYVSDVSKAKYKEYLQRYDGDTERAQRAMRRERFQVPEKSSFDYLFEHRNEPNIGELIDVGLADLEYENREKLSSEDGSGIFRNISFNSSNLGETKERNARLKQLLIDFSDERLQFDESHLANNDVIGDAYMFLIEKFASDAGKKAGEFFTPKEVSTLLARLTKSAPGSRICDPTCGSGSLLIKAGREVGSDNFSLYGQELNGSTWRWHDEHAAPRFRQRHHPLGRHAAQPEAQGGDALMKFDTVVAIPPSRSKSGAPTRRPTTPTTASGAAFRPRARATGPSSATCSRWPTSTARWAVVVPHRGAVPRRQRGKNPPADRRGEPRRSIIGLPANLFYGTGIPAAIAIFNKAKTTTDVLFIDASREFENGKNQNRLRDEDIDHIVTTYRRFAQGELKPGIVEERYATWRGARSLRERLQPQHPALCRHLRGGARNRHCGRAAGD